MAYVPDQQMDSVYEPAYALQAGTIFPQLCKPFCGKRGGCR
nr:spore coat associated protein CotJA [uncultured Blautia sp.]